MAGRRVRPLAVGEREAGHHGETLALRGDDGGQLGPGVYLVRVTAGNASQDLRIVAIR